MNDDSWIFHLALAADWRRAVQEGSTYYPPTFEADGFTHGTSDPGHLLGVANHFYAESEGDWVCLRMTQASLAEAGIPVVYEGAAPVGDRDGRFGGSEAVLFPHLQGGIPPAAVLAVHPVTRDDAGQFVSIDLESSLPALPNR